MENVFRSDEPCWVDEAIIPTIHARLIAQFGGRPGLRDEGLLIAALRRPLQIHAYEVRSISALASAYAYGLIRNHPFVDGNKRMSLVVTKLFLALNGADIGATQGELIATWLALAKGELDEAGLINWMETRLKPRA